MIPQTSQTQNSVLRWHPIFISTLRPAPPAARTFRRASWQEISGRIAAREREQTLAIAAQLEGQFAAEMARADAKAKADLELERQLSSAREARAHEEAREAAHKSVSQRQAEAEQARLELAADWQRQLAEAESARKAAEQAEATLRRR